ncbi:MAG: hypothetical protein AB8B96_05200 [Lysobacterales bacterium]
MNVRSIVIAASLLWAATGNTYETGTVQNSGTAVYRGLTFVPSSSGVTGSPVFFLPEAVPVSSRGLAFLDRLELRVPAGNEGPDTLYLFDQLPSAAAASSGEGALASAQRMG